MKKGNHREIYTRRYEKKKNEQTILHNKIWQQKPWNGQKEREVSEECVI
jgi:hypothetical protein